MIHPNLLDARSLYSNTRLYIKFKLLLATVSAFGGEVPLTEKELSVRLGTSLSRIRSLITRLIEDKLASRLNGVLFFHKYVDENRDNHLYAKHYAFFTCNEFLNEKPNVRNYVLHIVGSVLINTCKAECHMHLNELYDESGLFLVRNQKEAIVVIEKAKKYLDIDFSGNSVRINNVHKHWTGMGEIHSEGAILWVRKQLERHKFFMGFISKDAVQQFRIVMDSYYSDFGYAFATRVFDATLAILQQKLRERSEEYYYGLIYRDHGDYTQEECDEIRGYFRIVMQNAESLFTTHRGLENELLLLR
ncbi:helix-turn-helix domain-containing protein [Paenibacillus glycinis]|uniref:HTH gntR-type domain-containing protein n=1 Tax=Paenibacillus glycinis TaxID=2697035 RepID=A0ABW9XSG6_9BACL|nr:hypothetical protein [Paenibacillus glycinis]NBD25610.1 hypothetical protein [Paenibacillus glycinis]